MATQTVRHLNIMPSLQAEIDRQKTRISLCQKSPFQIAADRLAKQGEIIIAISPQPFNGRAEWHPNLFGALWGRLDKTSYDLKTIPERCSVNATLWLALEQVTPPDHFYSITAKYADQPESAIYLITTSQTPLSVGTAVLDSSFDQLNEAIGRVRFGS